MINKNITTKKNFDEHKILTLYYFITSLLRGVRWWYFICNAFANINFMRKIERKI